MGDRRKGKNRRGGECTKWRKEKECMQWRKGKKSASFCFLVVFVLLMGIEKRNSASGIGEAKREGKGKRVCKGEKKRM